MPLDSTPWSLPAETETKPDLSKPSLEGLSWLLRHMPKTHQWDFGFMGGPNHNQCGSAGCALGLAIAKWGISRAAVWDVWDIPENVQLSFFNAHAFGRSPHLVTPEMVADRLDAYLAETRK